MGWGRRRVREEGTIRIVLANLNSSVTGATNEPVAMEMQASDVP